MYKYTHMHVYVCMCVYVCYDKSTQRSGKTLLKGSFSNTLKKPGSKPKDHFGGENPQETASAKVLW